MQHNQYTNVQQPPSSAARLSARQKIEHQHAETYHPSSAAINPTSGLSEPPPSRLLPQPPPSRLLSDHPTPTATHQTTAHSFSHPTYSTSESPQGSTRDTVSQDFENRLAPSTSHEDMAKLERNFRDLRTDVSQGNLKSVFVV